MIRTKLAVAVPAALLPAAALAHPGAHLHPHGAGDWLTVALGLGLVAMAGIAATVVHLGTDRAHDPR